jgi:diacylglycerol kinase family enzyme
MYYYIVNPAAGRGQLASVQTKLRARLTELGIGGEWARTTSPGEATKMAAAAAAKGHTTIVAVGGDDTVNEVINGLGAAENVAVGIIPLGSTNRVASQLGISSWQQACVLLSARRLTDYSLIAAGQKFFLSTLTLGFETDLDKQVDTTSTKLRGRATQLKKAFSQARAYESLYAKIQVDDTIEIEADIFSLSISNQKFLNPLADNRLVVTMSDHPGRSFRTAGHVWQLLKNRSLAGEETATTRFLARRVIIETNPSSGIMVDGKVAGRTPIAIRLTDRRIRFITEKVGSDFRDALIKGKSRVGSN